MDQLLELIAGGKLAVLMDDAQELLEQITEAGGAAALAQIGLVGDESIVNQVNERAVEYARERAAEMVGMKWVDGDLVPNPNESWRIDEATRDLVRGDVTQALEDGLSNDALADVLADSYAFSEERALMIARTETAFADVAGNMAAYRESGQVAAKQWITGQDCCDLCDALDKTIVDLDEDFPDAGGDGPPLHPNCRCDVLPILAQLAGDE